MRSSAFVILALSLAACTVPPPPEAQERGPVTRATGDVFAIQNRVFDVPADEAFARALLGTLQDRGFRLVTVKPPTPAIPSGQVVATRLGNLEVVVTWRAEGPGATRVRVDALVLSADRSATQVGAPEYYDRDVFAPLAARLRSPARRA